MLDETLRKKRVYMASSRTLLSAEVVVWGIYFISVVIVVVAEEK